MPCNVIVYEKEGKTVVAGFNPMTISYISANEKLKELSDKLNEKMYKVIEAL
jgi:uncharacterized protein (DUF302 family)